MTVTVKLLLLSVSMSRIKSRRKGGRSTSETAITTFTSENFIDKTVFYVTFRFSSRFDVSIKSRPCASRSRKKSLYTGRRCHATGLLESLEFADCTSQRIPLGDRRRHGGLLRGGRIDGILTCTTPAFPYATAVRCCVSHSARRRRENVFTPGPMDEMTAPATRRRRWLREVSVADV